MSVFGCIGPFHLYSNSCFVVCFWCVLWYKKVDYSCFSCTYVKGLCSFSLLISRQQDLFRVLKAYTLYRPEEGYCQAQAPIAAVLLMHMPAEVSAHTHNSIIFNSQTPSMTDKGQLILLHLINLIVTQSPCAPFQSLLDVQLTDTLMQTAKSSVDHKGEHYSY